MPILSPGEIKEEYLVPHSRKKLDLSGQRFGYLTAISPSENVGSRTAWLCRCDCGKETVAQTKRLRNGSLSDCGCRAAEKRTGPALGLTYIDGTCVEMLAAKTVRRNNTSGVPGVEWRKCKRTWRASICFKGKRYYLGSFGQFEDAVKARKRAEENLHDRFLKEFATEVQKAAGN